VYLAYAGRAGHAMIDRELYLRIPGSATCSGAPFASPLVAVLKKMRARRDLNSQPSVDVDRHRQVRRDARDIAEFRNA
jgi:hypothetical protein